MNLPRPRRESRIPLDKQEAIKKMPQQIAKLATGASVEAIPPAHIVQNLRKSLPAREHTDSDPFIDRHVDSVIDAAISALSQLDTNIHEGRGAVVKLGVSHSSHLFEATAKRLTEALGAPLVIDTTDKYYRTMYDDTDTITHADLKGAFSASLNPASIAEYLVGSTPRQMAWVEQADSSDELYVPTASGVWLAIRSGKPNDTLGEGAQTEPHAPEIFLVVPSAGK